MVEIEHPGRVDFKGLYLLEVDALLELDKVLDDSAKEIKRYQESRMRSEVQKRLEQERRYCGDDPEKLDERRETVKEIVESSYPYSVVPKFAENIGCVRRYCVAGGYVEDALRDSH